MNAQYLQLQQLKNEISQLSISDLGRLREMGNLTLTIVKNCVEEMITYQPGTSDEIARQLLDSLQEIEAISEETAQQMKTDLLFSLEVCLHALTKLNSRSEY